MRKKILALLLCVTTVISFGACKKSTQSSAQMKIDLSKQVTKLADYKGIDLEVSGDYDVTDEKVENTILSILPYYGITGIEVKDRDEVKDGDYVKIDYTGYKDDKAFDNGSATDVMMDVSNNLDVTNQNPYIEGFCDDMVGAKVGDELSTHVTFPEEYQSEELAGQEAVFKIKIKGIYAPVTIDNLTDDMVKDAFEKENLSSKKELIEYVKNAIKQQNENTKKQAATQSAREYLVKNSKVDIPEKYMSARLSEYEENFKREQCNDTQTFEQYCKNNKTTKEKLRKEWKKQLKEQIKAEFIFRRIAELEKIKVDEDDFKQFIDYYISNSNNSEISTEKDVYDYYGFGNEKDGETTLRNYYTVNKSVAFVVDNANIKVKADDSKDTEK